MPGSVASGTHCMCYQQCVVCCANHTLHYTFHHTEVNIHCPCILTSISFSVSQVIVYYFLCDKSQDKMKSRNGT